MSFFHPMTFGAWLHLAVWAVGVVPLTRFLQAMWEFRSRGWDDWKRFHHAYIGVALLCVPILPWLWIAVSVACWARGLWLLIDDADQHWRQLLSPAYESPWHRRYARALRWLGKRSWGRWIVAQLKKLRLA